MNKLMFRTLGPVLAYIGHWPGSGFDQAIGAY